MTQALIEAKKIYKNYKSKQQVKVLSGIDLCINEGSSIAIMGASGEGKTTLLHILATLEKPDKGEILLNGKNIKPSSFSYIRNNYFGFIFQGYNLFEDLTALENILIPARIARISTSKKSSSYKKALHLLEEVNLQTKAFSLVKHLSGGEKQRIAIARAFCNDPKIIFADEPSGNLDHKTSDQIHDIMFRSVSKNNKTLVIATHDQELANLCDSIFILKKGLLFPIKTKN
jgi:lipoprotein-releasing system ATP-binding protein